MIWLAIHVIVIKLSSETITAIDLAEQCLGRSKVVPFRAMVPAGGPGLDSAAELGEAEGLRKGLRVFHSIAVEIIRMQRSCPISGRTEIWQHRYIQTISATMESTQPPTEAFLLAQFGEAPSQPVPSHEHATALSPEEEVACLREVRVVLENHRRQTQGEHPQQAAALSRLRAHVAAQEVQQPTTQQASPGVEKGIFAYELPFSLSRLQKWVGEILARGLQCECHGDVPGRVSRRVVIGNLCLVPVGLTSIS